MSKDLEELRGQLDRIDQQMVTEILPRKNSFLRPPVSNLDLLVVVAADAIPVTEPFLIDRVMAIAGNQNVPALLVVNKTDLADGDRLVSIYQKAGIPVIATSAATGAGIETLRQAIRGKICAFTGNSGVGKSSILNALEPDFQLKVGEVSEKLGRGRHTTRHVELIRLSGGGAVADTPGFSSFDVDQMELAAPESLARCFREFVPYLGSCQFQNCSHVKERGCAVLAALRAGEIAPTRHQSYVRLYQQAKEIPDWERRSRLKKGSPSAGT